MQAEQLLRFIQKPKEITMQQVATLQEVQKQYPFFQLAYALLAKVAHDHQDPQANPLIQTAALYATDRQQLKALLEDQLPPLQGGPQVPPIPEPSTPEVALPTSPLPTATVAKQDFINGYIASISQRSKQQTTNPKSRAQFHYINTVLQKGLCFDITAVRNMGPADFHVDLTEESTVLHDELMTETLAKIMVKQGKKKRAIEIYKKLMLKFPKKKTYFIDVISALENEL